jgi:hypothetical protein
MSRFAGKKRRNSIYYLKGTVSIFTNIDLAKRAIIKPPTVFVFSKEFPV